MTDRVGSGVVLVALVTGFVCVFDISFSLSRTTRLDAGRFGVAREAEVVELFSAEGNCSEGAVAFGKANEPDPFLVSILISPILY